jgi:hypothetical protein
VVAESRGGVLIAELDQQTVDRARADYPGYLDFQPGVHARGWSDLAKRG